MKGQAKSLIPVLNISAEDKSTEKKKGSTYSTTRANCTEVMSINS